MNVQRLLLIVLFLAGCGSSAPDPAALESLHAHAHPITGSASDYAPLLSAIGDAQIVLLGEATHGTHEFYVERARITRLLIEEKGFTAVALEADAVDAARADAWVRGVGPDSTVEDALAGFDRFPRWMWRNREFADLLEWIRDWNAALPAGRPRVGVYGIDLYGDDESRQFLAQNPPRNSSDERFAIEQNERVVRNAAEYHREARRGQVSTWNIRDKHMVETLAARGLCGAPAPSPATRRVERRCPQCIPVAQKNGGSGSSTGQICFSVAASYTSPFFTTRRGLAVL